MNDSVSSNPTVVSGARWFWWIAGLSLVNLALHYSGSNTSFVIGLAMTALAGAVFSEQTIIGLGLAALIIGFYGAVGFFAQREKAWAFYLGLGLYVIDALIYVKFEDWMSVAFHAYAIFYICKGLMAVRVRTEALPEVTPAAETGQ